MYIDNNVYSGGAPDRTEREMRCYEFLDALGVRYSRVDHDHADTIELCKGVEKVLGCEICKNLFLTNRQETEFYLLLMPGDKPFKTKYLSKQIGSARLSFAGADHMEKLLGVTPGSVTVLGLINDTDNRVRLLIDNDLLGQEYIGCHPCINTSTLKLSVIDVINVIAPAAKHSVSYVELPSELEEQ